IFGERLSDRIAEFGGSWKFLISFGAVIFVWIGANIVLLATKPFDPYPFILLNLILSCLAAVPAPVIMMSQNRAEARDSLRAEKILKRTGPTTACRVTGPMGAQRPAWEKPSMQRTSLTHRFNHRSLMLKWRRRSKMA